MRKRDQVKKFWREKVVPNKGKIAARVIRIGAFYAVTGPVAAIAAEPFNATEITKSYAAILESCFGDKKFGFLPVPRSYSEGVLCAAMLLTCGVAASQGLGNPTLDAACVALLRTISEKNAA